MDLCLKRAPLTFVLHGQMCVMSGCDFLRGLSSIGVKKAHAHIRRLKSFVRVCPSVRRCLPAVT